MIIIVCLVWSPIPDVFFFNHNHQLTTKQQQQEVVDPPVQLTSHGWWWSITYRTTQLSSLRCVCVCQNFQLCTARFTADTWKLLLSLLAPIVFSATCSFSLCSMLKVHFSFNDHHDCRLESFFLILFIFMESVVWWAVNWWVRYLAVGPLNENLMINDRILLLLLVWPFTKYCPSLPHIFNYSLIHWQWCHAALALIISS